MPVKLKTAMKKASKTYIVGLDGSALSLRAVQVASFMIDQYHDNLVIVTLGVKANDKADIYDHGSVKAKDVAQRCGLVYNRIFTEFVPVPSSMSVQDTLISLAENNPSGGAVLVLGAAGKGDESKHGPPRPTGQPPIGSIAMACVERCKQPVVLVKSGLDRTAGSDRIKRIGNDGTPGLNIMVALDTPKTAGQDVSKKAFDMALTLGTRGGAGRSMDSVFLYHVTQPGDEQLVSTTRETCAAPRMRCTPAHEARPRRRERTHALADRGASRVRQGG